MKWRTLELKHFEEIVPFTHIKNKETDGPKYDGGQVFPIQTQSIPLRLILKQIIFIFSNNLILIPGNVSEHFNNESKRLFTSELFCMQFSQMFTMYIDSIVKNGNFD